MKYGIIIDNQGVLCANCKTKLGNDTKFSHNFCPVCGNPIKPEAFEKDQTRIKAIRLDVLDTVDEAYKKGISIEKIITDLKETI